MKLKVWSFGLAVGIVVAVSFTICAFFVAVAPEATAAFIGYLLHIDLAGVTRPVTWANYFAGVLAIGIWTALLAAAAAGIYNSLISK
jgi:hydrogenase/urease accessory protein HupE